ncbi:flavodoxin [Bacillus manliponensis]|uniref:Flavodoxin n=1 Tax=Bacillus manliponensis TaxID=574376 RepID=A0A073JWX8_9BACI|nr:flavodoxin [Bacillus manliponensis]KEK18795.1 flavodoxin [Bacillus manliponensis]
MAKILIAYASMSGNTESIVDLVKASLEVFDHEIEVKEIENMEVDELLDYDGILLGSYTWGEGELPFEAEDFHDELENVDLSGKKAAVFGSGDTAYELFCEAVPILEKRLTECGAELVVEGLKIELAPEEDEDIERCSNFAIAFAEKLSE